MSHGGINSSAVQGRRCVHAWRFSGAIDFNELQIAGKDLLRFARSMLAQSEPIKRGAACHMSEYARRVGRILLLFGWQTPSDQRRVRLPVRQNGATSPAMRQP